MNINKFVLTLPVLCTSFAAYSQQVAPALTYQVENTVKTADDSSITKATYRFRLLEKMPDNKLRIEATLLDYHLMGRYDILNSARILDASVSSTQSLFALLILEQPVELILDPANRAATPQPGVSAVMEKRAREMSIQEQIIGVMRNNLPYYLRSELENIFLTVPANTASWQSADSGMLYTVTGAPGSIRTVTGMLNPVKATTGVESVVHNVYTWDDAAGKMLSVTTAANSKGTSLANGVEKAFRGTHKTQIQLLENAKPQPVILQEQIEVAIKLSNWTDALKKDKNAFEADSAKVMAFLQKYDPLYGAEKSYVQKKLGLLQKIRGASGHELYEKALMTTPNYLLKGDRSHLHNKLQNVRHGDTDSAMQLISYLAAADPSGLEGWLQHSLAQGLFNTADEKTLARAKESWRENGLSEEKIAELVRESREAKQKASAIITGMNASKDTVIKNAARPMYLYHRAEQQTNPDSLRYIAREFKALSPAERKSGNADRYALMLSKNMRQKGQPADADAVLKATVASLEKSTADTLNKKRFASQNMLAYAYYLQYAAQKDTNSKEALSRLAKAAAVSPRSAEEVAYDSFYDRVLLNSSENYREEYAKTLIKNGDRQEAMIVLAQQINADPSMLPAVQKAFAEHFPERNFKDFVENTVVQAWRNAPDFVLTAPDGTSHKLSDYRGKWLLLDFWGTWCAPCREELPKINAYAKKIKDSPKEAFFSIACYDTPEKITALFSSAGYSFPVGMSDNKVEKLYKVPGYPAKYIISPDGKMLQLAYSKNWEKTFGMFTKLEGTPAKEAEKNAEVKKLMN